MIEVQTQAEDRVTFSLKGERLEIFIPSGQSFTNPRLTAEYTGKKRRVKFEDVTTRDEGQYWSIDLATIRRQGAYQFLYSDTESKETRVLGSALARSITSEKGRFFEHGFYAREGELYRADLYVPYTRKSVRLRIQKGIAPSFKKSIEHLTIKSVKRVGNQFVIIGTAFVPGIASDKLSPSLLLQGPDEHVVWEINGKHARSMGNQKKFGFADCDYTNSGFIFRIPIRAALSKPFMTLNSRFKLVLRLTEESGNRFEKTLKGSPASMKVKKRTLATKRPVFRNELLAVISAQNSDEFFLTLKPVEEVNSVLNTAKRRSVVKLYNALGKPQSDTWLLYEFEASSAQDNGIVLFDYLQKNRKDIDSKFIINKDHPQANGLRAKYGRSIIHKYSLRHFWSLLTSKVLVSSQSRFHGYRLAPPANDPYVRILGKKPFVFLQHGVIALKKIAFHRSNPRVATDLFISSTAFEQEIICREYGYEPLEVPLIGMPRLDWLIDHSNEHNEILIMPTWRKWLHKINDATFASSAFLAAYSALLNDPRLANACNRQGTRIKLFLHPLIARHTGCFGTLPDHVQIVSGGKEPINELMMKAKLLITDYSSVAWDFLYMRKPVAFFHFDIQDYNAAHGSYFDLRAELGENSVETAEEVVQLVSGWLDGKPWSPPEFNRFEHYDHDNCARSTAAIESLLIKRAAEDLAK